MSDKLNTEEVAKFVATTWEESIVPKIEEYVRIPNQSPLFDPQWAENGYTDQAVNLLVDWVKAQDVKGLKHEVVRLEKRTPLIFLEIDASENASSKTDTVLLYGHLDKQPPLTGQWEEGLDPYIPVIKDGKLYGRGGADDGYAVFAAITALKALQLQGVAHARSVIIIEACEESGSPDLPAYITHLKERIGNLSLIVCLDSGCGNYEQFWMTSSLRGLASGNLRVEILKEGIHSGHASGMVPSSFRIVRQLLERLEDVNTGKVLPEAFHCEIPTARVEQIKFTCQVLGDSLVKELPFVEGAGPVSQDLVELVLNRTWRPALSVTGVEGFPNLASAGNVLRPYSAFKLSLRLPPNVEGKKALQALKEVLEKDPPYGAKVIFEAEKAASGWESPQLVDWLEKSVEKASETYFHKKHCYIGEGGTIPFMGMLGALFPQAQFVITGVLGPQSNAHGPNEFLHINMGINVTSCVVNILADHAQHLN